MKRGSDCKRRQGGGVALLVALALSLSACLSLWRLAFLQLSLSPSARRWYLLIPLISILCPLVPPIDPMLQIPVREHTNVASTKAIILVGVPDGP